jgi:hypothetical protein
MISELGIEKLNKNCDPAMLGCQASDELAGPQAMIGQQRALRALRFGLGIQELGFNIYVAGLPGTGRTTAVKRFLEELAQAKAVPSDWCYVNNFGDPYRPRALRLPPGQARSLQTDMKRMVETAQDEIRRAFESEEYATRQEQITHSFQQQREEIMARVNEQARQEGFLIQVTPLGLATIPMRNGKPLSEEEYIALGEEDKHAISEKRETIQSALEAAFRQGKGIEKEAREAIEELDRQIALHAIAHLVQSARDRYTSLPEVIAYLEQVQADILEHLDRFRSDPED